MNIPIEKLEAFVTDVLIKSMNEDGITGSEMWESLTTKLGMDEKEAEEMMFRIEA